MFRFYYLKNAYNQVAKPECEDTVSVHNAETADHHNYPTYLDTFRRNGNFQGKHFYQNCFASLLRKDLL